MAKLTKQAEILNTLHSMVAKEAALAQTDVSGKPGVDTKVTSISDSTETTDKNSVGPEKLNDKQKYEQKPSSDESEPVAKTASDIDKMASDILGAIQDKLANAQTNISGKPGKDTKITSVSDSTETTDKNSVGPEKLNDKQDYEQKPSTDSSEPVKAKKAEDEAQAVKTASYNLGASFCEALVKRASEIKQAEEKASRIEMMKTAGRRDFETLIANAAEQIKIAQAQEAQLLTKAAELGAAEFETLYKKAQFEAVQEENKALRTKLAEYAAIEKEAEARFNAQREEEAQVKLASLISAAIKSELANAAIK